MTDLTTRQEALYILAGAPMRPEPGHALALCELAADGVTCHLCGGSERLGDQRCPNCRVTASWSRRAA